MSLHERELSRPLGLISSAEQSGLILILTALSLCFVLFAIGLRLSLRLFLQNSWKWDDTASLVASAFFLTQAAIVFQEVHLGFGAQSTLNDSAEKHSILYRLHFANNVIYILTLASTKISICLLFLRITTKRKHVIAIWTIMAICTICGVMAVILVAVETPLTNVPSVAFTRWLIIGILDGLTELMFVAMAVYLVAELQMKVSRKCLVVLAFAIRLLLIPVLSLRLQYLNNFDSGSETNSSMALSLATICTQLELSYGILTGSITVLKPFMVVYEPTDTSTGTYVSYASGDGKRYFRNDKSQYSYTISHNRDEAQRKRISNDSDTHAIMARQQSQSKQDSQPQIELDSISVENRAHNEADSNRNDSTVSLDENSRKMTIRMKKGWKIHYEDKDKDGLSDSK